MFYFSELSTVGVSNYTLTNAFHKGDDCVGDLFKKTCQSHAVFGGFFSNSGWWKLDVFNLSCKELIMGEDSFHRTTQRIITFQ